MARRKPVVGISLGDPSGIGPEVVASALKRKHVRAALVPVVFGDDGVLEKFPIFRPADRADVLSARVSEPTVIRVSRLPPGDRKPGRPTTAGGQAQFAYVRAAIEAARSGFIDAICTAPVSKEQISRAGIPFMGHTEVLADAFGREVLMLMDGPKLRVALATNHVPIAKLPKALSTKKLVEQLELLSKSLAPALGKAPHIAVLGLNPHAGEGGLLGREEVDVIAPAILQARERGVRCDGPYPADGLFARAGRLPFDVVLAMFHDQGLVATKTLDFERTVNVTLGLPVPRTSPDHGVAYDIAGKGKASDVPMVEALLKAAALAG